MAGGTSSPRITSEAAPTGEPGPRAAPGRMIECGPIDEPSVRCTSSSRGTEPRRPAAAGRSRTGQGCRRVPSGATGDARGEASRNVAGPPGPRRRPGWTGCRPGRPRRPRPRPVQQVAVQPPAGQVDLGLDRAARAEPDEAAHRRHRVHMEVFTDLTAKCSGGVVAGQWGTSHCCDVEHRDRPFGGPQPQVHRAAARIAAGLHPGGQQPGRAGREHRADPGVPPDHLGPLVRVVGVHRDVRGADPQHGEDGEVENGGAGRHPHTDPVAPADPRGGEPAGELGDLVQQRAVVEHLSAGVQRGGARAGLGGRHEGVEQRAGRGSQASGQSAPAVTSGVTSPGLSAPKHSNVSIACLHRQGFSTLCRRDSSSAGSRTGVQTPRRSLRSTRMNKASNAIPYRV